VFGYDNSFVMFVDYLFDSSKLFIVYDVFFIWAVLPHVSLGYVAQSIVVFNTYLLKTM
jgi:hypothetical protein